MHKKISVLLTIILSSCLSPLLHAAPAIPADTIMETVEIPMRDGFKLKGEVYRFADSDSGNGGQQYPATVLYTIYDLDFHRDKYAGYWLEAGQIYIGVEMRDSYSGGTPFQLGSYDSAYQVTEDAYDLAEWISRQPWSDGKIGFKGSSGNGVGGSAALWANHPAIKAVNIGHSSSNFHNYWLYENGVRRDTFNLVSHRQVSPYNRPIPETIYLDKQVWFDWISKRAREGSVAYYESAGLYDIFQEAALDNFRILAPYGRAHVQVQPRWHGPAVAWDTSAYNLYIPDNAFEATYGDYLSDPTPADSSLLDYTVIEPNGVHDYNASSVWPVPHTAVPYYLNDDNTLSLQAPTTTGNSLTYQYDPNNPMEPVGGSVYTEVADQVSAGATSAQLNAGPRDQSVLAARTDQLRFESAPLAQNTRIVGPIKMDLYISTDVEDTMFVVKLIAIDPVTGYEAMLKDGVYMARYYDGPGAGQRLQSGQVYRLQFQTWTALAELPAGYKLGLHITSSAVKAGYTGVRAYYEVHPNSFDPVTDLTGAPIANNTIHMSSVYPSSMIIPIVNFNPDAPQMRVSGNANNIENGASSPVATHNTRFAPTATGSTLDQSFTIHNDSSAHALNLSGSPLVEITGTHASDFSVNTAPASTVAASGSTNFSIRFSPTATGYRTATVSIASDDPWRSPYTFEIGGWGASASAPEIDIRNDDSLWLTDGDTTPSWDEWTDFEEVRKYRYKTRTFTIYNHGTSPLSLTDQGSGSYVQISGASAFSIVTQPSLTIAANSSSTFELRYSPTSAGTHTATLSIQSNDADEGDFTFQVQGVANNYLPVVNNQQPNTEIPVDQTSQIQLINDLFYDPDNDPFSYAITLDDDSPAPAWLSINSSTGVITATPTSSHVGTHSVKIIATETGSGATVLSSNAFDITPAFAPPSITGEPGDTAVVSGNTATLSVTAEGTPPLSYQWYAGNSGDTSNPLVDSTDATCTTPIITAVSTFWVRVTDGNASTADSRTATVLLIDPPVVTVDPSSATVVAGTQKTLSVTATGGALSYQWYMGNSGDTSTPIPGATSASYTTPVMSANTSLWVRVTNVAGSDDSATAVLTTTNDAPSLLFNFGADAGAGWNSYANYSVFSGSSSFSDSSLIDNNANPAPGVSLAATRSTNTTSFCDDFSSITPAAYPAGWLNGVAAGSAWGISLEGSIGFTLSGLPQGSYTVEAYSYIDTSATSSDGTSYPSYKLDNTSMVVGVSGSEVATTTDYNSSDFTANLTGTQQMVWNGVNINEGEDLSLIVSSVSFDYVVINAFAVHFTATPPTGPTIFGSPENVSIASGTSTTLKVIANGQGTVSYQWYGGNSGDTSNPISAATSATYTTPALSSTTNYWVRVSDTNGSTDSQTAMVTVAGSSGYATWSTSKGLAGGDALGDSDPDHDGVANLIEYLLDTDPASAAALPITVSHNGSDQLVVDIISTRQSLPVELTLTLQGSDTLGSWSTVAHSYTSVDNLDGTWTHRFTQTQPTTGSGKPFIRLHVAQ